MKHLITTLLILIFAVQSANAINFSKVVRRAARVADDVPVHNADELVKAMSRNKASREALENAAGRIVKSADSAVLKNAVKTELYSIDPSLVRFADELDKPSQQYLLVLGNGAKTCEKNLPDMLQRAKFLERGGAETVAAAGMYGDEAAKAAMRFDAALHGGKIISPQGMRAVQLEDFGKLFTKYGDAANNFWMKYITPHWGKWLTGGALAWYLLDPQGFMDTVGNLTEEGIKRLTQAAGDVAATAISGVSKGIEQAMEKVGTESAKAVKRTVGNFLTSWTAFFGGIVILFGVCLVLPFTRYFMFKPFAFLFRKPKP
ncbi:MAG: hypothetical protein LBF88_14615 [Planctomycetaceae bacterium]|nr:hypothetical protein [Planctomycetaceae bacterium]